MHISCHEFLKINAEKNWAVMKISRKPAGEGVYRLMS